MPGIKLGMPVLSKGHLVGRIVEVNFISSRILLLNDLNSRIPVVISPNGDSSHSFRRRKKNQPDLQYLPENFELSKRKFSLYIWKGWGAFFWNFCWRSNIEDQIEV